MHLQFIVLNILFSSLALKSWLQRKRKVILVKKKKIVRKTVEVKKEIIKKHENGVRVSDLAAEHGLLKIRPYMSHFPHCC